MVGAGISCQRAARRGGTISGLAALVQHSRLKVALEPYNAPVDPGAGCLDAERDDLDQARVQGFEMEELLPHASAARAVLTVPRSAASSAGSTALRL